MNTQNFKIGACDVYFKGVKLGHTKGGVTLTYSPEMADIVADQFGTTPLDKRVMGEVWTATLRLTEETIANWKVALPAGSVAGAGNGRLTLGSNAGKSLRSEAGQLVLHPLANSPTDASNDVVFHKAIAFDEVEVESTNEDQKVLEIKMVALVDDTKADGSWLGHIGDSTD